MNDRIVRRLVRDIAASIAMCAFAACGTGTRATPAAAPPLEVEVATVSERDVAVSSDVFLQGESGTGKEVLARFIQHASPGGLNRSCNTEL